MPKHNLHGLKFFGVKSKTLRQDRLQRLISYPKITSWQGRTAGKPAR